MISLPPYRDMLSTSPVDVAGLYVYFKNCCQIMRHNKYNSILLRNCLGSSPYSAFSSVHCGRSVSLPASSPVAQRQSFDRRTEPASQSARLARLHNKPLPHCIVVPSLDAARPEGHGYRPTASPPGFEPVTEHTRTNNPATVIRQLVGHPQADDYFQVAMAG
jgi:hypothetical protein